MRLRRAHEAMWQKVGIESMNEWMNECMNLPALSDLFQSKSWAKEKPNEGQSVPKMLISSERSK